MSRLFCIILFLLATQPTWGLTAPIPAAPETKRVLVLYSLDKGHPGHILTEQGLNEVVSANRSFDVQLFTEYLDLNRFHGPAQTRSVADYLRRKYADMKIDVIATIYPPALDLLRSQRPALFPNVPIIAGEVTRSYAGSLERNPERSRITGTILGDNASGVLEAAIRTKPNTKRFALVAGTSPLDAYAEQMFRVALKKYAGRLELIELTKLPLQETLERVGALPPDTIVLYSTILRDGAGQTFAPLDVLTRISRAANSPVFYLYDTGIDHGSVGGRLISMELQGKAVAGLALRVMAGESPAVIPFGGEDAYVNIYDWRELQRWQIPVSAIPADAEIRYRELTLWEEHRWFILVAVSLAIVETALIFGLVLNLRRRKKAEQALKDSDNNLRSLSGKLLSAQEEERSRIARELHDDVTQRLAVLAIEMGKLELQPTAAPAELKSSVAAVKNSLVKISEDIHAISRKLHPAILDDLGLVRAIQSESAAFTRREGITVTFRHEAIPEQLPKDIALTLYRIIQESLRNIARHSQAESVHVLLSCTDNLLQLSIADSGVGFDPLLLQNKSGLGLVSMRERVKLVRGTIAVDSIPGEGTVISVTVPLEVNIP